VAGFAMNAVTAMVAFILSVLLTTAGQFWVLNARLTKTVEPGPKNYAVKTWFATSLPILLVEGFYLLLTYTDVLVLQFFSSPDDVAVYYAASKILSLVAFIYFSVSATIAHKFTAYHVAGNRDQLSTFLTQSIRWTFWPSLAATILILALGKPMLWLFGERFVDGYYLLFVLAVGLLARAAVGPVERLLNMLDQQRICAAVYALAFGLNLVLCIAFIPRIGVAGAAVATTIALIVESVLLFLVTKQRLGFHVFVFGRSTER
jgi:O-antigen/teichoic acid export membrane protein